MDELLERALPFASVLQARFGESRGAVVPVIGEASIEFVTGYVAVLAAGYVPALIPPLSAAALDAVLDLLGRPLVLCTSDGTPPEGQEVLRIADANRADAAARCDQTGCAAVGDDVALILFTSGSTSAPRGVMLSAENIISNTQSILAVGDFGGACAATALPLYYTFGLSVLHAQLRAGGKLVFLRGAFPEQILEGIRAAEATFVAGVPAFFQMLERRSTLIRSWPPTLRRLMVSGGALSADLTRALSGGAPGVELFIRYGVTEATAAASVLGPEWLPAKTGSIGKGLPGHPLCVLRPDGEEAKPGETGEVVIRRPHAALGYLQRSSAEPSGFKDGCFYTGDEATIDGDGFVFLRGRSQTFLKIGGHRIDPREIEDVLAAHPRVLDVAVFGRPDELAGQEAVALIVSPTDDRPSATDLRRYLATRLPAVKIPRRFVFVSEIPKTSSGKIRRNGLAALDEVPTPQAADPQRNLPRHG